MRDTIRKIKNCIKKYVFNDIGNCNDCKKIWTNQCPIRVWGRNEENRGRNLDVIPSIDYCSRFVWKDSV